MRNLNDLADAKRLIKLAIHAGRLQIKNGAEIYRAEDTVLRICKSSQNVSKVDAHVLPSGIFVSLEFDEDIITVYKSVGSSTTNMSKIDKINTFSRNFVISEMSLDAAFNTLNAIENENDVEAFKFDIYAGFCGAFFSVLFGGGFREFICAYIVTFATSMLLRKIEPFKLNFVVTNFIGAFSISMLTALLYMLRLPKSIDEVIIGSIMILVPGLAATNAVRDIMNSDFLSGLIGLTKAIFIALGIAIGVGLTLRLLRL
ncbi:Uncharacterized membrane protein YjjP, DUF1212 family [Peptoniphilus asaccharolyticus DSM 20463]|uniref:Uncharacterized membrane protein YjjP, DUF1212 family n=1 Tax=Peptoniphilus asaccharolyticus DSM 20463 TaxID=573058 RepID=A0A1W1UQR2_PEPAS|nr:threonine/serine exporter family protein [Peptoniphilus asaccharolyticus]MBL7575038.1 threonine/serine exporter family protein [Peptoniphilus asaccharolyticus]MBL7575062.1 threonine/serine exporter family protein [Peptoniphilus asaccharolyticus]SMB83437.1 Uncharacterized membrane protein YjjP, DUF1212 family [Peptoniphilus asaccharolyticus DSM 20463]